ncbi:allatostatin-A receptor-like [Asterias amurensis]|uniref:allatostatin-A receptor-like n=1 Tax=Asterias amurensis TaxID=7602 RepID=UPI003AB88633
MESGGIVLTVIKTVIAFSAILGNGVVIVVMTIRRKQFSSLTNQLIRHQSIIDLVSGVVFFLFEVVVLRLTPMGMKNDQTFLWEVLCRFVLYGNFLFGLTVSSTYNLVIISLERFMATCYPVKHRNSFTYFRINVAMGVAWVIGLMYSVPAALAKYINGEGECAVYSHLTNMIFVLGIMLEYLIPVTLMTFAYIRIFIVLRRKLAGEQQREDGIIGKAKRNVQETMLIAGIVFIICWTPLQIFRFLVSTDILHTKYYSSDALKVVTAIVMCNMSVNPIIYCFKYEHFRKQLLQLLRSRFRRNRVQTGVETNAMSMSIDPIQQTTQAD